MRVVKLTVSIAALLAAPAAAQGPLAPVGDPAPVSLELVAAGIAGATELARDTRFEPSLAYGAAVTYWVQPTLGLGVHALYGEQSVTTEDHNLARQAGDVWLLGADVSLRTRLVAAGRTFVPYARAGVGTRRYGFDDPYYAPAANLRGGLLLPLGPIGLFLEGGPVYSELHKLGFWEDRVDWMYGGGLSIPLGGSDIEPDRAFRHY